MRLFPTYIVGITRRHRRIRVISEPEVVDKLVTWDVRFWPSRRPRPTTELFRNLRAKESVVELIAENGHGVCRRKQHTTKQAALISCSGRVTKRRVVHREGEKCTYSRKTICRSPSFVWDSYTRRVENRVPKCAGRRNVLAF